MNYLFQIQDELSVWHSVNPDISKLANTRKRKDKELFARTTVSGDILFFGADFDLINSIDLKIIPIIIYQNGDLLGNGEINKEQSFDNDFKQFSGKIKIIDKYTPFEENGNSQYNIIQGVEAITVAVDYQPEKQEKTEEEREINYQTLTEGDITTDANGKPTVGTESPDLSYGLFYAKYEGILIFDYFYYKVECVFMRLLAYGFYDNEVAQPPVGTGWVYLKDETINNTIFPVYAKPIPETSWVQEDSEDFPTLFSEFQNQYDPTGEIKYYTRFRDFLKCIEYVATQIDSSVGFDNTGTNTDSFTYFKNTIGASVTEANLASQEDKDKPYKHLYITTISEAILAESGLEKSEPATKGLLTFNQIISYLQKLGFAWFLDERNYFILKHVTEITPGNDNPDLWNIRGVNCISKENKFQFEAPQFNKIRNTSVAEGLDFVGTTTEFPNVSINSINEENENVFFPDIDHIIATGADNYDDFGVEQFSIVATTQSYFQETTIIIYRVRKITGLLSSTLKNNSEISFSTEQANLQGDFPDNEAIINGVSVINIPYSRLKKRQKLQLTTPVFQLNQDFDFSELISIFGENAAIESITMQADSNISNLTLKK